MNKVIQGDCLEKLKDLEDNSVDSIVTDPPYELGFMGKSWDNTGIANNVEMWKECLRVLKPGAYLLSFGGTRTYHRMACAIEDAGFEIRDTIMWVYGSGFPKSLNIGKAIDKIAPRLGQFDEFAKHLTKQIQISGKTQKEIASLFPSKTGGLTGCVWNWANGANVPTVEQWDILKPLLNLSNEFLPLIERIEAEREVIGKKESGCFNSEEKERYTIGASKSQEVDITTAKTDEAKQWEGWGTALKPSHEPVVFCSKPLTPRLYFAILIGDISNNIIHLCQISNVKNAEKISLDFQVKLEKEGVPSVADNVKMNAWESLENVRFAEQSSISSEQKSSDLIKTKESSAPLNVKQSGNEDKIQEIKTLAGVEENIKALMDIIIFGTTEDTSQNIALLWNNISEELLNQANTLTIKMATRLITDLKILKLSATQSILESTGSLFKTPQNIPPNHEPICMARKPLAEKTVAENCLKWGTGGINIDESRVGTEKIIVKGGSKSGNGFTFCANYEEVNQEHEGRFPANLILSWNENEYIIKESITNEQKQKALKWIYENA